MIADEILYHYSLPNK